MMMRMFILALVFIFSGTAFAEGGASHGGTAVVCRGADGKITDAQLLDLFEAQNLLQLPLLDDRISTWAELREIFYRKLSAMPTYAGMIEKTLKEFSGKVREVGPEIELELTRDVFPTISKKNCRIEQLAVYRENGEILVDTEVYYRLRPLDRIALMIHEAVYLVDRKMRRSTNSLRAREIVAYLFSKDSGSKRLNELVFEYDLQVPVSGRYQWFNGNRWSDCHIDLTVLPNGDIKVCPRDEGREMCGGLNEDLLAGSCPFIFKHSEGDKWEWLSGLERGLQRKMVIQMSDYFRKIYLNGEKLGLTQIR
jgi:hypothetical protein